MPTTLSLFFSLKLQSCLKTHPTHEKKPESHICSCRQKASLLTLSLTGPGAVRGAGGGSEGRVDDRRWGG